MGFRLASVLLAAALVACAGLAPDAPRSDVAGCYRLDLPVREAMSGPVPPFALELTDAPYLSPGASQAEIARHRFEARLAREAYFVYPDTALRVAWWWESEPERRFGVGNHNRYAAFYVAGVIRGDRLEGEVRRWLYDHDRPRLEDEDAWTVPVSGRAERCDAL